MPREWAARSLKLHLLAHHPRAIPKIHAHFLALNREKKELLEHLSRQRNDICFVMPPPVTVIISKQALKRIEVPFFQSGDQTLLSAADLPLGLKPPPQPERQAEHNQTNPNAESFKKIHEQK